MTPYVILIVNHNYRNFVFWVIRSPIRHCLPTTIVTGNAAACFTCHHCRPHMPFIRSHMEEQFSLQSILLPVSRYKKINAHIGKAQLDCGWKQECKLKTPSSELNREFSYKEGTILDGARWCCLGDKTFSHAMQIRALFTVYACVCEREHE